jgi:hypothetical protein
MREAWVGVADLMAVDPPPSTARLFPAWVFPAPGDHSTDATDSGLGDKYVQDPKI